MRFPELGGRTQGSDNEGGLFVKLGDGEKVSGVFRGDPAIRQVHWVQSTGKYEGCSGGSCPLCADGNKAKTRFKINFIVREQGVPVAKIFDGSYRTYIDLKDLHEGGYDLEKTLVQITRKGMKTETTFTVLPLPPNQQPKPAEIAAIGKVPLNKLDSSVAPEAQTMTDEDVPF